jgi:hypothetical protein
VPEEVRQKIFEYCLNHKDEPDNQLARDILLLATKKESAEPESEEVKGLRKQAHDAEQTIKDNKQDKIQIGTEDNPKERFFIYNYEFEAVYCLLL